MLPLFLCIYNKDSGSLYPTKYVVGVVIEVSGFADDKNASLGH